MQIAQVGPASLAQYASVPISFVVERQLRVVPVSGGLGGLPLEEEPVDPPYLKDYDAHESPLDWPTRFDVRSWVFLLATSSEGRAIGAATLALDTPGLHMLEGRKDLAVLWDIRVHPDVRGQGVGSALFRAAADRARAHGCTQMSVETQNTNVDACRFYARKGCHLGGIHLHAYAATPFAHDVQLLWYLDLTGV